MTHCIRLETYTVTVVHNIQQWRGQDLLRGGAEIEIMSRGTHGGLRGRVQQLLDD